MYEIDYKRIKKGYSIYFKFFAIAAIIATIFLYIFFGAQIKKVVMNIDCEVPAYDVKVKTINTSGKKGASKRRAYMHTPTYYYIVDGKEYVYTAKTFDYRVNSSTLKEKNIIYYNSQDPSICLSENEMKVYGSTIFAISIIMIFPIVGLKGILDTRKIIKKAKWLAQNGTLIKGLKYKMVSTGTKIFGKKIMRIQVEYKLPSGDIIELKGNPRYDFKTHYSDSGADLLIDPNDTNNYYIDFEIN